MLRWAERRQEAARTRQATPDGLLSDAGEPDQPAASCLIRDELTLRTVSAELAPPVWSQLPSDELAAKKSSSMV